MRKFFIAILLVLLPSISFAQTATSAENPSVGSCKLITNGYWQKLSDFSWAPPGDKLNNCLTNGFAYNNLQTLNNPLAYNNLNGLNNTGNSYLYNNQNLGQMSYAQWLATCVVGQSIVSIPACQGYNPNLANSYNGTLGYFNNLLNYPQFGRDYLAISNGNSSVYVDLASSKNKFRDALIGIGMGWILDRLTS